MLIYPSVKQAPIAGLSGFGGGTASQVFSGGGPSGGFGGYDYVGLITKDGPMKDSGTGNVAISYYDNQAGAFSYNGGTSLTGVSGGSGRYYNITNPVLSTRPWIGGGSSWTTVEKLYFNGSQGNTNHSKFYVYKGGGQSSIHRCRHDDRSGGCSGSWGTSYPYVVGYDTGGGFTNFPFCSVGYEGWWVNLGSWDADNNKYYWARSDSNDSDGEIAEATSSYDTDDWETYLGQGNAYFHLYMNSNVTYADSYIIYGKATTTLAEAQKYNMLSRSNHIDPDVE